MKKFIKSFFCSHGHPSPVYFWATIFLALDATAFVMKLSGAKHITDAFISVALGFVLAWVGIYNIYKNVKDRTAQKQATPAVPPATKV